MNNIRKFRGKLGLTQTELGEAVGLTRSYICVLESPKCTSIDKTVAENLARFFGCNIFEVYGDNAFKNVPKTDEDKTTIIKMLAKTLEDNELKEKILELVK
jgi:DNA-binding XRE family transcriptional regulator